MKRPLPLRLLPPRIRQSVFYRHYQKDRENRIDLFENAELALCPQISMYDLIPGDIISGNIAYNGFYEWQLSKEIAKLAAIGGTFVDVGANMGYYSLLWAGISPTSRVIAFEAAPRNIELFRQNIELNELFDSIALIPKAASNLNGFLEFETGPSEQTGWGGISVSPSTSSMSVPCVSIDSELVGMAIDVLKIDVEGADTLVLQGCENMLRNKQIDKIYFEQNEARMSELGIKPGEAQTFLQDCGYCCAPFGKDDTEWFAFPNVS